MSKPPPKIPDGTTSSLRGISENFSFHASPEAFIATKLATLSLESSAKAIRVKILNRNVVVLSEYAQIEHVLRHGAADPGGDQTFVAAAAYEQFMAAFFPSPNLLLAEAREHADMRGRWEQTMGKFSPLDITERVVTESFTAGHVADLYVHLKGICNRILLGLFLNMESSHPGFDEITSLQEDLLRGQFSLVPLRVNIGIWRSPRDVGIGAKEKLQQLILDRLRLGLEGCPFSREHDEIELANHILLYTSSLCVKALASLMTAYLLNIFLFKGKNGYLWRELLALQGDDRDNLLRSILCETERLSPPIVGIMRRVAAETVVPSHDDGADILLPEGWDAWLYFVRGGRDASKFGPDSEQFLPERSLHSNIETLAFADGRKACLGRDVARQLCVKAATTILGLGVRLEGQVEANGVRGWLGWDRFSSEDWAKDMKQLPTQRPSRPIPVQVVREPNYQPLTL